MFHDGSYEFHVDHTALAKSGISDFERRSVEFRERGSVLLENRLPVVCVKEQD